MTKTKVGADLEVGPAAATRRSFIAIAGAALSAPVAAASSWLPPSGGRLNPLEARLAELEDLDAIRALNQSYARHVSAGAREQVAALFANPSDAPIDPDIREVAPDGFGEQDAIEIAADRQTATARLHVTVRTETAIGPDCPLVEMARLQGGGVVSRLDSVVFENAYVRRDGVWKILRSTRKDV
jgi:hypothetical protein